MRWISSGPFESGRPITRSPSREAATPAAPPSPSAEATKEAGISQINWIHVLFIAQMFLVVNGVAISNNQFPRDFCLMYVVMALGALAIAPQMSKELQRDTAVDYVVKFLMGFTVTLLLYWALLLPMRSSTPTVHISSIWPLLLFQAVFVVQSEEILFRGFLPWALRDLGFQQALPFGLRITDLPCAILFSIFHYAAYQAKPEAFIGAALLAIVWLRVSRLSHSWPRRKDPGRPIGIVVGIGSHLAWNLCSIGVIFGQVDFNPL